MAYLPRVGEVPLSVYYRRGRILKFLVEDYGGVSTKVVGVRPSSVLAVRGPYGHGFGLESGKSYMLVAGGSGAPPVINFIRAARKLARTRFTYILGARTADQLFLLKEVEKLGAQVFPATDDGSMGFAGNAVSLAESLLEDSHYDALYACGPESMLESARELAEKKKIRYEGSYVRDVRCAVGICGLCVMEGLGLLVCADGPVFTGEVLAAGIRK